MARESLLERIARLYAERLLGHEQAALAEMADAYKLAAKALVPQWEAAYKLLNAAKLAGASDDYLSGFIWREQRLATMLAQMADIFQPLGQRTGMALAQSQQRAIALAQASFRETMALAAGEAIADVAGTLGLSFPQQSFERMVGSLADGSPITDLSRRYGESGPKVVREALIQAVATGESPRVTARRINAALGRHYGSSSTLVRTELLRTYRESTRATYLANQRYVKGWIWSSALDTRTCPICWAMHGSKHPLSTPMASHPVCRCSMMPDLIPGRLKGLRDEPLGPDRFRRLPEAQQIAILGPLAQKAYKQGLIDLPDLVRETYSPVWGAGRAQRSLASVLGPDKLKALLGQRAATRAPRVVKPVPKPAPTPPAAPAWSPSMMRADAERFAAQGDLTRSLYHATSSTGYDGIRREGFDLSRSQWGRVWGNGAYMSDSPDAFDMYASAFGSDAKRLELMVFSRKTLRVDISGKQYDWGHHSIVEGLPDGIPTYDRRLRAIQSANLSVEIEADRLYPIDFGQPYAQIKPIQAKRQAYYDKASAEGRYVANPSAEALTRTLRDDYGYDALDLVDEPHRASVGGSQVIVWDVKRVVAIIDDD